MTQIAATSNAAAATEPRRTQTSRPSDTSFASLHAAAVTTAKDKDKDKDKAEAKSTAAPKGERTEKVDGHHYMEIVSGPRNGMFINNTGNGRDGDAFVIVKRHGREFHIYGAGDDRAVYEVGRQRAASGTSQGSGTSTDATGTAPAAGTGTTPAAGTGTTPAAGVPATTG
jgi:hypothetical protein